MEEELVDAVEYEHFEEARIKKVKLWLRMNLLDTKILDSVFNKYLINQLNKYKLIEIQRFLL